MPPPIQNFDGIGNVDGVLPPDTNGDVGPNHYVQTVNVSYAIYSKSGTLLLGPSDINTLWSGFGGLCQTTNRGDPIVLYDHLADRWLISQFAFQEAGLTTSDHHQCVAISATSDPTGSWYRYDFLMSTTKLNDYPKFGVWPDAYYMSANQFDGATGNYGGALAVAFERDQMLLGLPADAVPFDLFAANPGFGGMLPSDLDGQAPPTGAPNYFVEVDDDGFGWPTDRLQLWEFHVDWTNPGSSTFGVNGQPNQVLDTAPMDMNMCGLNRNCIPQPGTSRKLDAISDRLMNRLQYRNFGTHQALVTNHTVDVDVTDHAGIRWYELRKTGSTWSIHQQDTYAPDSHHRWMGSIAMDGDGNIALGYSISSSSLFPSIRYAGRLAGDPLGTLPQAEATLIAGGGSQTHTSSRWGDYSMMAVDPTDDATFWYTQEYYSATSSASWKTRIGSFSIAGSPTADLSVAKSDSPDPVQPGQNLTYTITVSNAGPDGGTGVTLTDTLPSGVAFVSATPSQGSCGESGGVVTCTLGAMGSGSSATVTIVVNPSSPGTLVNSVTVVGNEIDPNSGNNSDSEQTVVSSSADLSVAKTDSPDPALVGRDLTYTVMVTNNGPSPATNVTLTDNLPAGLMLMSIDNPAGTCSGTTVLTCGLGTFANGASKTVTIVVRPTETGPHQNSASVSASEPDSNTANNTSVQSTTVNPAVSVVPEGATHSGFATFLLLANPLGGGTAKADVTFLTPTGPVSPLSVQGVAVDSGRRRTINVNVELGSATDVSTKVIQTNGGAPLVTEVSMHKSGSLANMEMSATDATSDAWIIPEGATHSGFSTFVTIANPDLAQTATVATTFLEAGGGVVAGPTVNVGPESRKTINVNVECACQEDVSTKLNVTSGPEIVAAMSIHKLGTKDLGIGGSVGVKTTATTWVVAEGATHSGWHTFVLVANPGGTDAAVDIDFFTPTGTIDGGSLTVPANSRRTIDVNIRCACSSDVSTLVRATSGSVAVESSIQKEDSTGFVIADSVGSEGANIAGASGTAWLAAEGATHSGFTTFILIANPDPSNDATVEVTFLTPTGPQTGPTVTVPAASRRTVTVNSFVTNQDVSTLVEATSGAVVVEMSIDRVTSSGFSKGRSLAFRLT